MIRYCGGAKRDTNPRFLAGFSRARPSSVGNTLPASQMVACRRGSQGKRLTLAHRLQGNCFVRMTECHSNPPECRNYRIGAPWGRHWISLSELASLRCSALEAPSGVVELKPREASRADVLLLERFEVEERSAKTPLVRPDPFCMRAKCFSASAKRDCDS